MHWQFTLTELTRIRSVELKSLKGKFEILISSHAVLGSVDSLMKGFLANVSDFSLQKEKKAMIKNLVARKGHEGKVCKSPLKVLKATVD